MDNGKRSSGRKGHSGGKALIGGALLLALLAGGHFGLGIGRAGGGLLTGEAAEAVQETAAEDAEKARETATDAVEPEQEKAPETAETVPEEAKEADAPQDDGVLTVTVREDKILYKGEEVTLVQLEEDLLRDYKVGEVDVELRDDHAIKAAYDEVKGLLDRLHIPFTAGK